MLSWFICYYWAKLYYCSLGSYVITGLSYIIALLVHMLLLAILLLSWFICYYLVKLYYCSLGSYVITWLSYIIALLVHMLLLG